MILLSVASVDSSGQDVGEIYLN